MLGRQQRDQVGLEWRRLWRRGADVHRQIHPWEILRIWRKQDLLGGKVPVRQLYPMWRWEIWRKVWAGVREERDLSKRLSFRLQKPLSEHQQREEWDWQILSDESDQVGTSHSPPYLHNQANTIIITIMIMIIIIIIISTNTSFSGVTRPPSVHSEDEEGCHIPEHWICSSCHEFVPHQHSHQPHYIRDNINLAKPKIWYFHIKLSVYPFRIPPNPSHHSLYHFSRQSCWPSSACCPLPSSPGSLAMVLVK